MSLGGVAQVRFCLKIVGNIFVRGYIVLVAADVFSSACIARQHGWCQVMVVVYYVV